MGAFWLKRLSSALPLRTQQGLKRFHFAHQIRSGRFATAEPEYARLCEWVAAGDWVIAVGANVGHYTTRLSQRVGPTGRVLAFEPVPETFELLAANMAVAGARNVSLFSAAASTHISFAGMRLPQFSSGLTDDDMASITSGDGEFKVLTLPLDSATPSVRVTLVKVDFEGHELPAPRDMRALLQRDLPRLIVEGTSPEVETFLRDLGYTFTELPGPPNRLFSASPGSQT